ncbi:helix-turn-helix transcriptional regulator [Sphingobacterium sp. MYb388]|uniref:helix-turn-helix transcriptional regulator n=1 Tax=Sphingobacterium sp. MYb388 TaxID=2745437 RepID=UPI0030B12AD7
MTNKEKFLALVSKEETKTVERAKARIAKKAYTRISNRIAISILSRLDELSWKQKDLAEKMEVSPQQVNKWVKGNENFTLETLVLLSKVLAIDLITVATPKAEAIREGAKFKYSEDYSITTSIKQLKPIITMSDDRLYENNYQTA